MDNLIDEQAASQLQADLQGAVRRAHRASRPILTHLNADTTWLLSLAYPDQSSPPPGRTRYNVLIDPWLDGAQEDVAGWFSRQWHLTKSTVQTIDELESLIHDVEAVEDSQPGPDPESSDDVVPWTGSFIDAVAVSHEFTDHCHKATLLQLSSKVPVLAARKTAEIIRSWHHFDTVFDMAAFTENFDWRKAHLSALPDWVGLGRLVTKYDALHLHSAIVICVREPQSSVDAAEAIIYTPHGVEASTLSILTTACPPLRALAFLHGLHDISIAWSKQLNLGAVNAVRTQKLLQAKYWIGTHDEEKHSSGLIAALLRRKALTVSDVLTEFQYAEHDGEIETGGWTDGLTCVELRNGESILLA